MRRVFGLETEYGLVAHQPLEEGSPDDDHARAVSNEEVAWRVVDAVRDLLPSLPDTVGCGAFLSNGSRVYVDGHHLEWATPEVSTPWDLVRCTLAGQRVLENALARCGGTGEPAPLLFRSNVDYVTRQSWGCHESIQHRAEPRCLWDLLIPHLVSRVVFTGAGGFDPRSPGLSFVLSPRALFLVVPVSRSSTDDHRGIVHSKHEPLGQGPCKRLHLICGESLCSERAMWLKAATTVLVVAMIDAGVGVGPSIVLADPVSALHAIVRDPSGRAKVLLMNGRMATAFELQRHYLGAAETHAGAEGMPEWTRTACAIWRATVDQLERAPDCAATMLDWGIKRALFGRVLARHGLDWTFAARWTAALREVMSAFTSSPPGPAWPDPEALLTPGIEAFPAAARLRPILNAHGFDREGLGPFLRARRALFECDIRFGQLGGAGIFDLLDRDGVLTHHVPGVGGVDCAVAHPPAGGRARVRGDAIRRLASREGEFVCDWASIRSRKDDTFLDLSDPFEQDERWRPFSEYRDGTGG